MTPTLLHHRILVLGGHQEVFNGGTSFKIYLYTIVAALFLDTSTQPPIIWNSYVWFGGVVLLSVFVLLFLGWIIHPHIYPVQSPPGVVAISQCCGHLLVAAFHCWSIWFLLYDKEFQQHYILHILVFFRLEKAWFGARQKVVSSLNYEFCYGENLALHHGMICFIVLLYSG